MLEVAKLRGFKPLAERRPRGRGDFAGRQATGYAVIVRHRDSSWISWLPKSPDDSAPQGGEHDVYRTYRGFGTALTHMRKLNQQWIAGAGPSSPEQWASMALIDPADLSSEPVKIISPLSYRSHAFPIPEGWAPAHLLDVPPIQWKEQFADGSDLPVYGSLDCAIREVASRNRKNVKHSTGRWQVILALENVAIEAQVQYRCWKPNEGMVTLEATRRFHLFDRSSWPNDNAEDLSISAV